ncbi:MAG: replicative DNA helicase [Spirochaetia bacterium]|nr:replicative DNA helicase [Spirochaetia bacterium]MBQ3648135.1 replicative DNA helicase [Spirochaetia bacterium]MBQ3712348.1 replicative DNA helicase [Spirochaetia bacterium]MBQ6674302.1 replicative DNA helicase [Spirochaetia bacterium]MBR0318177.1 replicative DNA helicase [Spirochaetia bacterium]
MADSGLRDKIPPNNLEAEKATLGAILMNSSSLLAVSKILSPDDFYKNANKKIFQAMLNLDQQHSSNVDILTVIQELKRIGELDAAGGAAYVSSLTSEVPTTANVEYYAQIVQDNSVRRSLIQTSNEIIAGAFDDTVPTGVMLENAERKIFDITEKQHTTEYKSISSMVSPIFDIIESRKKAGSDCTGIPSGYPDLDSKTNGFQNSELIIIGARPSKGKTALALSMAANIAGRYKKRVGFFSLETDGMALMQRLLAGEAKVNSRHIQSGFLSPREFSKLMAAGNVFYENFPMFICDTPNMRLIDLRTEARKLRAKEKVEIIFIDYIGLISSDNKEVARHEQVAEISRSLKQLARELKIPIVVLCQVKREVKDEKPSLSDLRESGSIEQDADVVLFLHDAKTDKDNNGEQDSGNGKEVDIIIGKNRNGPIGEARLMFLPAYTRFEPLSKEQQ